jgi:hypothetical protein
VDGYTAASTQDDNKYENPAGEHLSNAASTHAGAATPSEGDLRDSEGPVMPARGTENASGVSGEQPGAGAAKPPEGGLAIGGLRGKLAAAVVDGCTAMSKQEEASEAPSVVDECVATRNRGDASRASVRADAERAQCAAAVACFAAEAAAFEVRAAIRFAAKGVDARAEAKASAAAVVTVAVAAKAAGVAARRRAKKARLKLRFGTVTLAARFSLWEPTVPVVS